MFLLKQLFELLLFLNMDLLHLTTILPDPSAPAAGN
jgi:hypothetical protein